MRAFYLLLLCVSAYTGVMLFFAPIYMLVDHPGVTCGIAVEGEWPSFHEAFLFSLQTLTTIGYGIPNGGNFFNKACGPILIVVYFEAIVFILLNATIIGIVFSRISVANKRASQIIFSDKAAIRCVRNRFYFMFQVGAASLL